MEEQYFYLDRKHNTPKGPHPLAELSDKLLRGELYPTTEVAKEGDKRWQALGKVLMTHAGTIPPSALAHTPLNLPPVPGAAATSYARPTQPPGPCPYCKEELSCESNMLPETCPGCGRLLRPAADTLWQNMKFAMRRPFTYRGRATRKEFWSFWLLYLIVSVPLSIGAVITASVCTGLSIYSAPEYSPSIEELLSSPIMIPAWVITALLAAVLLWFSITILALAIRRIHDINRSAWWVALAATLSLAWQGHYYYKVGSYLANVNWQLLFAIEDEHSLSARLDEITMQINLIAYQGIGIPLYLLNLAISLVMLFFLLTDSTPGANKYGPSPKYPQG